MKQTKNAELIDSTGMDQRAARLIDISNDEEWTPFLEKINDMLIEEKAARHEDDNVKLSGICTKILQYAYDQGEFHRMRELVILLGKRRGQSKRAITDMLALCMDKFLPLLQTRERKFQLLETLREASDGKMFLEREYSTCTTKLVNMLEEDAKIDEAAKIIQEIAIETYGSLEQKEKVEFILYQMKLVLARNDFVRCQILSRKISNKALNEDGLQAFKIRFQKYMVHYWIHEKEILNAAKAYQIIYDTINKAPEELKKEIDPTGEEADNSFRNFVLYLLICPYNEEKVDLLKLVESMYPRELEKEERVGKFVRKLLTFELMPVAEKELEQEMSQYDPFNPDCTSNHRTHMLEFLRQLVQQNIRVIQKYYSRISINRMSQLLLCSVERSEVELSDMVVNKRVNAKINRLSGIVTFSAGKKFTNERLNSWNTDINTILAKVEETCHLINRERVTQV